MEGQQNDTFHLSISLSQLTPTAQQSFCLLYEDIISVL
jgi:hypothetical protein